MILIDFLDKIKAIPITNYAARLGFTLVKKGRYYSLAEHDSVMIDTDKNCFWRNSSFVKGQGGTAGSIIDFAIEFGGCADLKKAMRTLAVIYGINGNEINSATYKKQYQNKEKLSCNLSNKEQPINLKLPIKGDTSKNVYFYLCKERGINECIVDFMFSKNMIYEDKNKNCVFVSESKKFACFRGTKGRYIGDISGSDYNECFFFYGSSKAETLIVAESVIDVMSIMTQFLNEEKVSSVLEDMIKEYAYLALSGTNKLSSLYYNLEKNRNIKKVIIAFDNDEAGHKAKDFAIEELLKRNFDGTVEIMFPPYGKDWNDVVVMKGNI